MKNKFLIVLLTIVTLFLSCDNDEPNNPNNPSGSNNNVVEINEDIKVTTVWHADSIYVIKDHDFWVTATLTIQAGTIIKFSPDGEYMSVSQNGTVIANGTASKPITFTSFKDDANGGDQNKDGNATSPASRDWAEILLEGNGSSFKYCKFLYGGKGSYLSTLRIYGGNATVSNCTFADNYGGKSGDFYYGVLDASNAKPATIITNNTFYNNNLPLSVESVINIDASNVFHNPGNTDEVNNMNGIFIYSESDIFQAVSWKELEVPFVINDNDLWIESNGSLTLADKVVIKFTPTSTLLIQQGGVLNQNNTNVYTSFKDDTKLGDTNGDKDATNPGNGDWNGLYDDVNSVYYNWTNIYYDSH